MVSDRQARVGIVGGVLLLAAALVPNQRSGAAPILFLDTSPPQSREAAETFALPITPPLDQGDSDLCWVYAALSMLETNYLSRHPGSRVELSRAALQRDTIADRFARRIRGEPGPLEEGGLSIEALKIIREKGIVARADFHDIVDSEPIFDAIEDKLANAPDSQEKLNVLREQLKTNLGETPPVTHLDGEALSPQALARAMLEKREWMEYDLSRDGFEGLGPSHDPDARPDTRVTYVKLDRMIGLIHRSLQHGQAVVAGSDDHAFLIYGGDYDKDGKPIAYLIKDSLAPLTRRAGADELHQTLNDVTVAMDPAPADEHAALGGGPKRPLPATKTQP